LSLGEGVCYWQRGHITAWSLTAQHSVVNRHLSKWEHIHWRVVLRKYVVNNVDKLHRNKTAHTQTNTSSSTKHAERTRRGRTNYMCVVWFFPFVFMCSIKWLECCRCGKLYILLLKALSLLKLPAIINGKYK